MKTRDTTYFRREWIEEQLENFQSLTAFSEKLGTEPSTVSRWIKPGKEATGRAIGSVLNNFPVSFETAFVTVREEVTNERVQFRAVPNRHKSVA